MRTAIILYCLLWHTALHAQLQVPASVISAAGHSGQNAGLAISSTLGETFIFSQSLSNRYFGQGFHSNHTQLLTSTHELNGQVFEVRLFPNPSSSRVFIETELEVTEIQLYSGTGQLLSSIAYSRGEPIRLQHLPAGIYLVHARLQSGHRLVLGRIIKVD
jgi:hypothetical protein